MATIEERLAALELRMGTQTPVRFPQGMSKVAVLNLLDKVLVGINADGSAKVADVNQLVNIVGAAVGAGVEKTVPPSSTLPAPAQSGKIMLLAPGVYTQPSGDPPATLTAPAKSFNVAYWDGSVWTVDISIETEADLSGYATTSQLDAEIGLTNASIDSTNARIDVLESDAIPPRVNKSENTDTPEAFPITAETANHYGITISDDTTSPVKDYVGKKRVFLNTTTADGGTCFQIFPLPLGTNRPNTISVAYWVKRSEFEAIFTTTIQSFLSLRNYSFSAANITDILNGIPISKTGTTSTIPEFTTALCTITKLWEQGDYIRLRATYSDIQWKGTFTGTTIDYYFALNGNPHQNKPLEFIDFTVLFDGEPKLNVINPDPDGEFESNVITLKDIDGRISDLNSKVDALYDNVGATVHMRDGNKVYFSSAWNGTYNLVRWIDVFRSASFSNNPTSNLRNTFLADRNGDQTVSSQVLHAVSDDITPANVNGSYVGANHGWALARVLNKTGHGKDFSDIGNIYESAGGIRFIILHIVNANSLWIISENQAVDGYSYSFVTPTGTLTYVSGGGNNQGAIESYTTSSLGNMFSPVSPASTRILLDGNVEITANGDYSCQFMDIRESYDIYDLPSIIYNLVTNRPSGGYTSNVQFNTLGADKLFTHSIVYRYNADGSMLINHGFRTHRKMNFNFHGFIQAGALTTGSIYVPKSLPISGYDFRQLQNWDTGPGSAIHITGAYWENPDSPPDRVINLNNDVIFHMGYLIDRGVGLNRKDHINDSMFLNTTRKMYPMAVSGGSVLEANSFYSVTAFRQYTDPDRNPDGRTNLSHVTVDGVVHLWLDYHGSLTDTIVSLREWVGKRIEVVEQNSKVQVIGDVVTDTIEVVSTATSTEYGFAYIRLY